MIDLMKYGAKLQGACGGRYRGRVRRAVGILLEVEGLPGAIGDLMHIERADGRSGIEAEVVGLRDDVLLLLPLGTLEGIGTGAAVRPAGQSASLRVGPGLLGRVLDARGRPIDGAGALEVEKEISLYQESPGALQRPAIDRVLPTGVRAIDALLTIGRGQRLGIFSGSGVGKSTLIAQVARGCAADVVVIGLIGERNREVKGFIEDALGPEGLERAVVVVSTSDRPPLERYRGAFTTVAIAEYFRDRGKDVLLVMDSITRFAGACREIGLATGEASTVRGFPPSFFATVPKLVERLGRTRTGSITGLLTVLIDADSMEDPVGDTLRGLLDGHIILSRELTRVGRWPAIDPLESLSRLMKVITTAEHQGQAARMRRWLSELETNRDLLQIGAYKSGTNPALDEALRRREALETFLCQRPEEFNTFEQTQRLLQEVTR